jgi:hypothetical protein
LSSSIKWGSQALVAHTCKPLVLLRRQRSRGSQFKAIPEQTVHKTLSLKNPSQTKRAGGLVQVVEYLSSKYEALSSDSSTTKNKIKWG